MKKINAYLEKINFTNNIDEICQDLFYGKNNCKFNLNEIYNNLKNIKKYDIILSDKLVINSSNFEDGRMVRLGLFVATDDLNLGVIKLVEGLKKRKIKLKLEVYDYGYVTIDVVDWDTAIKVIDFINCKMGDVIKEGNPLCFTMGKVMISYNYNYSYLEILANYLKIYKNSGNGSFKDYMIKNYYNLENENNLYQYLELNTRNISLGEFFTNLEEMTKLILGVFQDLHYEDYKDYLKQVKNNKLFKKKYYKYDEWQSEGNLLEELVHEIYCNYGEDKTRESIIKFHDSGNCKYITRKNDLRKKINSSKLFMIYLWKIEIDKELDRLIRIEICKKKSKILENICKENYLNYIDDENVIGKIQVAKGLIRMSYGDYSAITRHNGARKLAIENIDANDVEELIKNSLYITREMEEKEIYLMYAEYIEKLCTS